MTTQAKDVWSRVLLALLPVVLAGLVAYGALTARVQNTANAVETKANRETVEAQYNAILDRLNVIDRRLERIEGR